MRRREASLEGPATPFPPRPTEAAAARRDKLLSLPVAVPTEPGQPLSRNGEGRWAFSNSSPRLDVRRKVYPTPLEPGSSALAPLPSPSFGAAGAQFLRLRRAPLPSKVQRAPGAGVAALLPGCGFRERCSPRGRGAPEDRRPPAGDQGPRTGVSLLPTPPGIRGWLETPHRWNGEARN